MTLNEMKENLIRLGAVQRLSDLNKERDALLKLLNVNGKEVKAKEVMKSVKAHKTGKKKHWTQTAAGKKRMSELMKAKYAAGWKGRKK